jgi:hypothetical protein
MLSINHLKENKYPLDHVLTKEDKKALIKENEGKNFSYECLMKEMFQYSHITVESVLNGWGGVRVFYP